MRLIFAILMLLPILARADGIPASQFLYLNPDLHLAPVYSTPGHALEECDKSPEICKIMAIPGSEIRISGDGTYQIVKIQEDGKEVEVPFVAVKIAATSGLVDGWMDARQLRTEKLEPLYAIPIFRKEEVPESTCKAPIVDGFSEAALKEFAEIKNINELNKKEFRERIIDMANDLRKQVGQCPLERPTKKAPYLTKWKNKNIYDAEIMPLLEKQKGHVPAFTKEDMNTCKNGRSEKEVNMTWDDLVDIDAMARTVSAEMHKCFQKGLEFPMAVAKIAINREDCINANCPEKDIYLKPKSHQVQKPIVSMALTASYQFSPWNYETREDQKSLLMALCPARFTTDPTDPYHSDNKEELKSWKGSKPSDMDLWIWSEAVQIATEAVLTKCWYKERTKGVFQENFTSGMTAYHPEEFELSEGIIEGRKIKDFDCLYLWKRRAKEKFVQKN